MKLRFSLRLAFLVVTLAAVGLYVLYVRPTAIAERFVRAITNHDYESARSLFGNKYVKVFDHDIPRMLSIDLVYAELAPREWSDILACRRRIILRIGYREDDAGRRVEWTTDTDIVAHTNGLSAADYPNRIDETFDLIGSNQP